MKDLSYILIILAALVLQVTFFSFYPWGGARPDLFLIVVIILALFNGYSQGAYVGFLAGLLQDLFSGGLFGVNIISKLFLGYLFGSLEHKIYYNNFIVPIFLVMIATFMDQLIVVFLSEGVTLNLEFCFRFRKLLVPLLGYNVFLSIFIYPAIYYFQQRVKD